MLAQVLYGSDQNVGELESRGAKEWPRREVMVVKTSDSRYGW